MSTFDIFIKGINPERINEAKIIRINSAKALQIELSDFDELLVQPNGACIRRNVGEDEAKKYQHTLSTLGLICLYTPTKQRTNLELLPIEEDIIAKSIICPNCDYEMFSDEKKNEPEKCVECGVDIAKFIGQQQQNDEREAIKTKLLASQTIQKALEVKKQQEDAERQRKVDIEKEVMRELGVETDVKKPLNVKQLAISGGFLVVTAIGGYLFSQANSTQLPKNSTPSLTTDTEVKPATNSAVKGTKITAPVDAQHAMQKTHDQATQVLSSFGLDPDAFANAASSDVEPNVPLLPETTEPVETAVFIPESPNVQTAANIPSAQITPAALLPTVPQTNFGELFSVLNDDDITWDYFLAQNAKNLLERQQPENAVQLIKFIISTDVYVDALGELFRAAQQGKQTKLVDDYFAVLETRLAGLPLDQKAAYFVQASRYLTFENGTNRLLTQAETLLSGLPKPESQFNVVLKLAVIYSKIGNIISANSYFNKINALLIPITDLDTQALLRAEVALAYQDINNTPVAVQWLNSTEPLIKQLKPETIKVLISRSAQCNQWQSVLTLLTQVNVKEHYDAWLYHAISVSLKANFVTNALELRKSLHSPIYQALASTLIAYYSPAMANELLASVEQVLNELPPFEKVLISSQLVDYYGKVKNLAKVKDLILATKEVLTALPVSDEKDRLLGIVAQHYAHGLQNKEANNLLVSIQSPAIKTRGNVEINQLANVGMLLK